MNQQNGKTPSTRLRTATPWLYSTASVAYTLVRAHRISRAEAATDPLLRFVIHHSDLVLVLCGNTAVWYAVARRRARRGNQAVPTAVDPQLVRQLRQVLSALLLGIGLLERRIEQGAYERLTELVARLRVVIRLGVQVLERIEQSPPVTPASPTAPSALGSILPT